MDRCRNRVDAERLRSLLQTASHGSRPQANLESQDLESQLKENKVKSLIKGFAVQVRIIDGREVIFSQWIDIVTRLISNPKFSQSDYTD